jgi:multidrug efflux system outer membrane protein
LEEKIPFVIPESLIRSRHLRSAIWDHEPHTYLLQKLAAILPLPKGEGQGEGESDTRQPLSSKSPQIVKYDLKQFACYGVLPLLLAACSVGSDYKKPEVTNLTPTDWRWKTGEPRDSIPKGEWWKVFNDPVLDRLETDAVNHNQNLQAVVARVEQARAVARLTRSQFFPELSLDPAFTRQRTSGHLPTPIPIEVPSAYINTYSVPLDLSYEVDLWGRVRRSFESARAQAQASVADYQNALLTLTADVAVNYFLLRSLEFEIATLHHTVELRQESVRLLEARFAAGAIPESDLARAKTELATVKEDLADTLRPKAETVDALALLCGAPASSFEIAEQAGAASPPAVPPGLPSLLLERRPDIAGAERRLAAKNAEIGVARAAYFPALRLTGQAGYLSAESSDLFEWNNRVWSIGPSISLPLFNGGRTAADVKRAEGEYQEALATYRQAVLIAFKEVEDSLAQIRFRNDQAAAQTEALSSAQRVAELARVRYQAGATTYLEVVDADRTVLQQQQQEAVLQSERFAATVRLIKALGGGWAETKETAGE